MESPPRAPVEPFHRPLADLRHLVRRTEPKRSSDTPDQSAPREQAAPSPDEEPAREEETPQDLPPDEPVGPDDFEAEMERTGVRPLLRPSRVAPKPEPSTASRRAASRRPPAPPGRSPMDTPAVDEPDLSDELRAALRRARRREDPASSEPWRQAPRIDLHGLPVPDAWSELERLAHAHRRAGTRRLRVVTGRGAHAPDGQALVRQVVEERLARASWVADWTRAGPDLGGDGTLLVRLRPERSGR